MVANKETPVFYILVNDYTKQFAFIPSYSNFGLADSKWVSYMLDEGVEGDWQSPTPEMKSVVSQYVAADYIEVKLVDLIGTKWVTHMEFSAFMAQYKNAYAATQRLGQAFLNHFKDRFTDPWPELFYCEEDYKATGIIGDLIF